MNTFLFFILGGNRFEVTLEKSNKNFSKKIQQVSDFLSRLTANLEFKIVHLCLLTSLCVFISLTVFFFFLQLYVVSQYKILVSLLGKFFSAIHFYRVKMPCKVKIGGTLGL